MANEITGKDVQKMVDHWLKTPVNGYLGSDYGQDGASLLQRPLADTRAADTFLQKLRNDVQILDVLPPGSVNLYAVDRAPDKKDILIEVAGTTIALPNEKER